MAIQSTFPTTLDPAPTDVITGDTIGSSAWNQYLDGIYQLETKVGVNSSAVAGTLDYILNNAAGTMLDHNARHQDTGADELCAANLSGEAAQAQLGFVVANGSSGNYRVGVDFRSTSSSVTVSAQDTGSAIRVLIGGGTGAASAQVFTSSGNYTPPTGHTYILIQLWGAGGSGGSCSTGAAGGGGGGGSYIERIMAVADISSPVSITIGTGGSAVSANTNGIVGGNSTFGSYLTAYGGGGGGGGGASTAGGGGGGGGTGSAGTTAAGAGGAAGGNPMGGAHGADSNHGGGGGGSAGEVGGFSGFGGGGGGSGTITNTETAGGNSYYGGAGGGGGSDTGTGAAGGTSVCGGAGGAGATSGGTAVAGSQPGGGGGGMENGNSGAGGNGKCVVISW